MCVLTKRNTTLEIEHTDTFKEKNKNKNKKEGTCVLPIDNFHIIDQH